MVIHYLAMIVREKFSDNIALKVVGLPKYINTCPGSLNNLWSFVYYQYKVNLIITRYNSNFIQFNNYYLLSILWIRKLFNFIVILSIVDTNNVILFYVTLIIIKLRQNKLSEIFLKIFAFS